MRYPALLLLLLTGMLLRGNCFEVSFERDTVKPGDKKEIPIAFQTDSLIRDSLKYEYQKIKDIAYKNSLTKELYKMVFKNPSSNRVDVMRSHRSDERFLPYWGKTIGSIEIKILPPYGRSVYDTAFVDDDIGFFKKVANAMHMKTTARVISRQLTVQSGDRVWPFELVQAEMLLRRLPFIDDATILLVEDSADGSKVDLLVICKDDFSWGVELSSDFMNKFGVSFRDKNFASLGHQLDYRFTFDHRRWKAWGNVLEYNINNVFGWHVDITGYFQNDYTAKQYWVDVEKPFLTPSTRWAAGLALTKASRNEELPELDVHYSIEPFKYRMQDVWLGRSFLLSGEKKYTSNLYLASRFLNIIFNERPQVYSDSNQFYYNRRNVYNSITYRKIRYYKANLIYDFGRTEDIPVGLHMSATLGVEDNDFRTSGYASGELMYSYFNLSIDKYYAVKLNAASYVNSGGFNRSLFSAEARHFSRLFEWGAHRFRFYTDMNYAKGYKRYQGNYLYFTDDDIYDFDSDTLRGHQKLAFSLASTLFLPHIVKGFRTSVTGSLELGFMADENSALFRTQAYWGIGAAINLRNDNLVFKTISIRLSFYPNVPYDMNHFKASVTSGYANSFYDFGVYKPQIIPYR